MQSICGLHKLGCRKMAGRPDGKISVMQKSKGGNKS